MACWDVDPYICTYDSGGGKDYSSVGTWEGHSDVDLSGYGIVTLDCFDSQHHTWRGIISGASGLDSTHKRRIRSASGCTTPFAGKRDTGAIFEIVISTTMNYAWQLKEEFIRLENLCFDGGSINGTAVVSMYKYIRDSCKVVNCVVYDHINAGSGSISSVWSLAEHNNVIYGCITHDYDGTAYALSSSVSEDVLAMNCTAIDGVRGFLATSSELAIAWNCYAASMSSYTFTNLASSWSDLSGWNGSDDAGAEYCHADNNYKNLDLNSTTYFVSVTSGSEDYNLVQNVKHNIGVDQRCGRQAYNDLSASKTFDNFIYNGSSRDPLYEYDIKGTIRPDYTTADEPWDVGASEYVSVGAYTLDAEAGSYSKTGQTANLEHHKAVDAGAGSFSLTGQTANLEHHREVAAGAGSFSLTGEIANLEYNRLIDAEAGAYSLSGQIVNLEYNRLFDIEAGSYALTGQDVSLRYGYTLDAEAGSFILTGQIVNLEYNRLFIAGAGSFSLTGQAVNLEYNKVLTAEASSYSLSGQAVALLLNREILAGAGSYSLTGQIANLELHREILATAGSYVLTGEDADLVYGVGYQLVAEAGAYALTGQTVDLLREAIIDIDAGSYALNGQAAGLGKGFSLDMEAGSYSLTGQAVDLLADRKVDAEAGAYVLIGQDVAFVYSGAEYFPIIFDVIPRDRIVDVTARPQIKDVNPRDRIFDTRRT